MSENTADKAHEQGSSSTEPFPNIHDPVSEAQLHQPPQVIPTSPPARAPAPGPSSSSTPATTTDAAGNTLVWLPPSQYSAIRDKWQDQFIWSPTAFASDLPVNQTSFISVNPRARAESAVTKPPFATGSLPPPAVVAGQVGDGGVSTLGDATAEALPELREGEDSGDGAATAEGTGQKTIKDKSPESSANADPQDQETRPGGKEDMTESSTPTQQPAEPRPNSTAQSKWAKKRPTKTKHWHSFHLMKNVNAQPRRNSSTARTSNQDPSDNSTQHVPSIPSRRPPHPRGSDAKGTGRRRGIGRIPVLIPLPKSHEEDEEGRLKPRGVERSSSRHRSRSGQSHGKSKERRSKKRYSAEPLLLPTLVAAAGSSSSSARPEAAGRDEVARAARQSAEQAIQEAVSEQIAATGSSPNAANGSVIVAEMPEDGARTPREPLVLPAQAAAAAAVQAREPLADMGSNTNLQVPRDRATRSRKNRQSPMRRAAHLSAQAVGDVEQTPRSEQQVGGRRTAGTMAKSSSTRSQQSKITTHMLPANSKNSIVISKNGIIPTSPSARSTPTTAVSKQKTSSSQMSISLNINLDLEVQLKTKLHGDVTLSLFE